jgi:perosamine synthetase
MPDGIERMPTPFEPGAPAAAGSVPLCVPELGGREWEYVKECLDTGWVSSAGPFVERFERELATRIGARHAVATASGTAALHVALLVAGVEPGDEVLVSTLTFIAPANAIRYVGAWPVFIDAEPQYWQMDPDAVERFLDRRCERVRGELRNTATGRRVKAILPVDILGHPADMQPLVAAAQRHGLAVVEDATESLGAEYDGLPVGRLADLACFSFNGNKLITTGGGGMIVTDDERLAARARYLSTQAKDDPIEYVHGEVGYNYRLTNIQAALGCAQLERLDHHLAAKRRIALRYAAAIGELSGIGAMPESPRTHSAFWMYTVTIDQELYGVDRRSLMDRFAAAGIQTRPLWQPLHRSAAHAWAPAAPCPVADRLHRNALSLPCSVGLTSQQQERVIGALATRPAFSPVGSR